MSAANDCGSCHQTVGDASVPHRPAGGARHAGVRALGVLVVTAALAVLSHLAWPPVMAAILGTVPSTPSRPPRLLPVCSRHRLPAAVLARADHWLIHGW